MKGFYVLCINQAPPKLSGKLNRFMLEISPGVFLGKPQGKIFRYLWNLVVASGRYAICFFPKKTEQGFDVKICGDECRQVVKNYDGIHLLCIKNRHKTEVAIK